jgi:hypothetical protein
VFENKVLRRYLHLKRVSKRMMQKIKDLRNLCSASNIITVNKPRKLKYAGYGARTEEIIKAHNILVLEF